jgi:hypothetical protein
MRSVADEKSVQVQTAGHASRAKWVDCMAEWESAELAFIGIRIGLRT